MKNWPTFVATFISAGLAGLGAKGMLSPDLVSFLLPLLTMVATAVSHRLQPPTSAAAKTIGPVALVLLLSGCAGSLGEARHADKVGLSPDSPRCQTLDDRHAMWSGIGKGAAVVAGGAGLSTLADDDPRLRTGLAVTSAVAGVTAAVAAAVTDANARSYARECQ